MKYLCNPHLVTDLCAECEEGFLRRQPKPKRWFRVVAGIGASVASAFGFAFLGPVGMYPAMAVIGAAIAGDSALTTATGRRDYIEEIRGQARRPA